MGMIESDFYDLLEEAQRTCGKHPLELAAFLGARLVHPVDRGRAQEAIFRYTGTRPTLADSTSRSPQIAAGTDSMDTVVKQSGQIDEIVNSAHSAVCPRCRKAIPVPLDNSRLCADCYHVALYPEDGCYWCLRADLTMVAVLHTVDPARVPHPVCPTHHARPCRHCGEILNFCQCATIRCEACGLRYGVGQSPVCKDGHDYVGGYHPFTPYFDIGLGREVTSLADRWQGMKAQPDEDGGNDKPGVLGRPRLEYRDHPSKGTLAARRDRVEHERQERRRGHRP